jgi:hypothetical protein
MTRRQPHPVWEPESGPAADALVFGVIEWPSEAGASPSVFMGSRAAVEVMAVSIMEDNCQGDPAWFTDAPGFLDAHPFPSLDDHAGVHAWLCALREATTSPWVTLYTVEYDALVLRGGDAGMTFEFPEEAA